MPAAPSRIPRRSRVAIILLGLGTAAVLACGGTETVEKVVERTVIVEKPVEKVVQQTVVQTKVVEKQVEKVVQQTVVQTKVVEKQVEKVVEKPVVQTVVVVATPTPGAPIVAPTGPSGKVVVAETRIIPPVMLPSKQGTGVEFNYVDWGVFEYLLRAKPHTSKEIPDPAEATFGIGTAWEADPKAESVTITIRTGVKFHGDWGELTAQDVAFSFNEGNKEGTRFYRNSRDRVDRWEAVDDRHARVYYRKGQFNPRFVEDLWNAGGGNTPMISKKLVESLGEEKAVTTMIGTGPYVSKKWVADDEVILEANPAYWREDGQPQTKSVRIVAIPEEQAKIAAMKTGEVDIAAISSKFLKEALDGIKGSKARPVGAAQMQVVFQGGNYWAKTWREENKQVFPRDGLKADAKHPWIGDPRDPASMERAKKVREALTISINRQLLNEKVLAGLGSPLYIYWGPVDVKSPFFQERWRIKYDPDRAKKLLAEAGAAGATIEFWVPPDNPAVDPEVGFAVAQMWRDVGLKTAIEATAYGARRPTLVARTMDIPWLHHGGVAGRPDTELMGTMRPTAGFSHGLEAPDEIIDLYFANRTEPDFLKRIENNTKIMDWVTEWRFVTPTVVQQAHYVAGPRVLVWEPHSFAWKDFLSPETVIVR